MMYIYFPNFYFQTSWQGISNFEKQFLVGLEVFRSNFKIKIQISSSFILIFNLNNLKREQTDKY